MQSHCKYLILFLFCFTAKADFKNRGAFPFGEIESMLGNAGVAGVGSTGAVYYNPAALMDLPHPKIAVSGSTYFHFKTDNEKLLRIDGTDLDYSAGGFNTVPSSVVSTFKGDNFSWAYFVLVPESVQLENRVSWNTPNTRTSIVQMISNSDLWLGASAAKPLSEKFSLGLSLFLIRNTSIDHTATVIDSTTTANTTASSISHASDSVWGLSLTLGVLYKANNWLSIGYRVQSPMIHLSGSANVFSADRTVNNGTLTKTDFSDDNLNARHALPLDMSLGFKFLISQMWSLYFDTSLQFGGEFVHYPNSSISTTENVKATPRFNLGNRFALSPTVTLSTGFFINPGATDTATATALSSIGDLDYLGFTTGVDFAFDKVKTGIGFFYAWSSSEMPEFGNPTGVAKNKIRFIGALVNIGYNL